MYTKTTRADEDYDLEIDDWERLCWYIIADCPQHHLSEYSIPDEWLSLLGNHEQARQRRDRWNRLFLLPIYWRPYHRLGKTVFEKGWHVHHDWERRVTLMTTPDEEHLQPLWMYLYQRATNMYLTTTATDLLPQGSIIECHICQVRTLTRDDTDDSALWHKGNCYVGRITNQALVISKQTRISISEQMVTWLADPQTPSQVLAKVAAISMIEDRLLQTIASNPNTSSHTLYELFSRCPKRILDNPALPLLLVSDPNWFKPLIHNGSRHKLIAHANHEQWGPTITAMLRAEKSRESH